MTSCQRVTETLIFHLKEGVSLENVASDAGASPAGETFVQLTDTLKAQPGFVRQIWGQQVEDPSVFVWSIDWVSFEDVTAFTNSDEYKSHITILSQTFDLRVVGPLTMYTRFNTDAGAAFEAGVTEISIYTLPTDAYTEETKAILDESLEVPSMEAIKTVGRSPGGATGWVFETQNATGTSAEQHSLALHGVFGYPGVEDHVRWRASPEHAQVMKDFGAIEALSKIDLRSADLPGGGIFAPGESMFHVKFQKGA